MEGLTLSTKEQSRLQILNGVLERYWSMKEAARSKMGVKCALSRRGVSLVYNFVSS